MSIWHRSLRRVTFASRMMIKVSVGKLLIVNTGEILSCVLFNAVENSHRSEAMHLAGSIFLGCCS